MIRSFYGFTYGLVILGFSLALVSCKPHAWLSDKASKQIDVPNNAQNNNQIQSPHQPDIDKRVNAHDYNSFWLWGNVSPKPYLNNKSQNAELYILQGEVGRARLNQKPQQQNIFQPISALENQGMGLCHIESAKIWLVYRTTTLDWHPSMMQHIVARLNSWKNFDNQVIGLQIDFDSATGQLDQYANFLQNIRQQLPKSYLLSATGLLDWVNADNNSMKLLKATLDEVVIQTYQGKHTVKNYQSYLPTLARLDLPFKVGLVQHGEWQPYRPIEKNSFFKGYVVFLLRPSR